MAIKNGCDTVCQASQRAKQAKWEKQVSTARADARVIICGLIRVPGAAQAPTAAETHFAHAQSSLLKYARYTYRDEAMDFYETPLFTNRVLALLDDDSYGALQWELANRPNAGAVIVHGGGWRKIRWAAQGRGKRGGVRVIYYWWTAESRILMGNIYSKNEKENLSARELKNLRKQIEK